MDFEFFRAEVFIFWAPCGLSQCADSAELKDKNMADVANHCFYDFFIN